jgi:hypothetical protein
MVARDHILASINSRKFPNLAGEIKEFKANPQNNFSELVNTAIKKELDFRRPKIENYVVAGPDDDDGLTHQTELNTLKFPPIDDPEALRDREFQKRFFSELTPKEQGRAIKRCYISHEIIQQMMNTRGSHLDESLIVTEEEEERIKAQDLHHSEYHLSEIAEVMKKTSELDGMITVTEKYKDVCYRCEEIYKPYVQRRDYEREQSLRS